MNMYDERQPIDETRKLNLDRVHLDWCLNILKMIQQTLDQTALDAEKLQGIQWLVKQALKVERED